MAYEEMLAEIIGINGHNNEPISADVARPLGPGPFPGVVPDDQVIGDTEGAVWGTCSGERQTFLFACKAKNIDAAVELWGGRVVMSKEELTPKQPIAPIEFTTDLSCPLLGLFGNDDRSPTPEQVDQHETELKKHDKSCEFHRYDGAGHGFFITIT